jgi:exosortase/archaeosortase family protein
VSKAQETTSTRWQHLRTALSASAVFFFVYLARSKDLFTDFSRPTVLFALRLLGLDARDSGPGISVGRLEVPWTRDCAGLNLLIVLIALTIWVNRSEKAGWRYLIKLLLAIPAAVVANVLRVLTLLAYREKFYPNIESPQLHYFLGLVWLLPFIAFAVPRGKRHLSHVMLEAMHAAAVVALLTPASAAPGGDTLAIATVFGLIHSRYQSDWPRMRSVVFIGWILLGCGIALVGMESFWLPWLMICPLLVPTSWIFSIQGLILTASTHSLFGMIPGATYVTWAGIALAGWRWFGEAKAADTDPPLEAPHSRLKPVCAGLFFLVPFLASTFMEQPEKYLIPPSTTTYEQDQPDTYLVSVPSQPANIGMVWFNPAGNGRHHSMKVCMKYRGIDLEPTQECPDVTIDRKENRYMREFFMQDGELLTSYSDYVWKTVRPFSAPGVHWIFVIKTDQMSAIEFNKKCLELGNELHRLCVEAKPETAKDKTK